MTLIEEKIKKETSAMAVVVCCGKVLVTVEDIYGKSVLSLPKGHVEQGETALDAAIRECFEETGVKLSEQHAEKVLTPYSYGFTTPDGLVINKTITPILFRLDVEQTPCTKEERISKAEFMPIGDFLQSCAYDNVRKVFEQL